jgi:cystathionine beta-lyase/cystathionine gamma-synthase
MNHGNDLFDPASFIVAHDEAHAFEAVVPPIVQTSLFTFSSYDEMVSTYRGEKVRPVYTRGLNPTVRLFEEMLAKLEGAEDALGFASGMSAISSTVLSFVSPGDRIVAVRHVYPDAFRLFGTFMQRMNIEVVYVDGRDEAAVEKAMPGAKLFYMESPTSWVMEAHDVGALAAIGKRHGAVTVIDNSWASPVFHQPISLGVDLVVHSASKYLGGHSDTVAGVVAGSAAHIKHINEQTYGYLGGKLSPFDGWLLLRGLRTLPLRLPHHMKSGLTLAERLKAHALVERVNHPAYSNHPGKKTLAGYGGLFSFEVTDEVDIPVFVDALRFFRIGVSWGGHESLVVPAKASLEQTPGLNSMARFGVSPRTIRFNVGLESVEDLWADIAQAFEKAKR